MDKIYRNFYKSFYKQTGGFIPVQPLNQSVFPGDFFQVRNGNMIILGNIFRGGIVERESVEFGYDIPLNQAGWYFSDAVKKSYSSRGTGERSLGGEFEYSKLILSFGGYGAFIFRGNNPQSARILNWNEIQRQLIIKLTQTCYSFRDVYVVTETATTSDWTLAIAGSENGELEKASIVDDFSTVNFSLVEIFGHESAKTIQSKDIEFYHREEKRKPGFFKAKKLQVKDDKMETFISRLMIETRNKNEWAGDFFDYGFQTDTDSSFPDFSVSGQASVLDMLQVNQLNPNTALDYFKWNDANLEDVEKLFFTYEQND